MWSSFKKCKKSVMYSVAIKASLLGKDSNLVH